MKKSIKIISWNVNGIRAVLKKDFVESIKTLNTDIICVQEIKTHLPIETTIEELGFKHIFWNCSERKGYSGTAIFSKIEPINISFGIGILDLEARVITCEFDNFFLINVYTPNSKRELERLDFRYNIWDKKFLEHIKKLEVKKPVIACGDFNVAHEEIDLKNPKSNKTTKTKQGNAGFTDKERLRFSNILDNGFIDAFRYLKPTEQKYSWWSYMFKSREKNVGWRIDYFIISNKFIENLENCDIRNNIFGSDHCPIELEIKL